MSVYLDYAATTPVNPAFIVDAAYYMRKFPYNPSAAYAEAGMVKRDMEEARAIIAESINAYPSEIIFTSGATEANNMVIKGCFPDYIVTSPYEHPSVSRPAEDECGYSYLYKIKIEDLKKDDLPLNKPYCYAGLFTYMLANNEIGFIQDIKKCAKFAHECYGYMHTDATQAYGHIPIDVKDLDVDYMTVSLHKCGCAKGIGFLYVKTGKPLHPYVFGGGQENGKRPGTENTAFIYAAGQHVKNMSSFLPHYSLYNPLRESLSLLPYCHINEPRGELGRYSTLPNILSVTVDGVRSDVLVSMLNERGICVSAGSACHSGDPRPSEALLAFGLTEDEALRTIRISWGKETTWKDIDKFITTLKQIMEMIREE